MGEIRLGTCGWSYKEWVGGFYPDKKTKMLSYYSQIFGTAEIDSTFYAYPSKGMVFGWLRYTPKDFVFCAKLPQIITHKKKLDVKEGVLADLAKFLELLEPLQRVGKLFALLIQLPPSLQKDLDLLESFLKGLPEEYKFAVEFRHRTWWNEDTWKLLREYNTANTIVDEPLLPPEPVVTADFAYLRWHGKGKRPWYNYRYSVEELKPWVPKVREVAEKTKATYGYFNNHYHGYAVENCLQVLEMLGISTFQQTETKRKTEQYLNRVTVLNTGKTNIQSQLELEAPLEVSLERLVLSFMDSERFRRALEIEDDELKIENVRSNIITARIKQYSVIIDLDKKVIIHDCKDWARNIGDKSFCKHVGKVFLEIPETKAKQILKEITNQRNRWQFQEVLKPP